MDAEQVALRRSTAPRCGCAPDGPAGRGSRSRPTNSPCRRARSRRPSPPPPRAAPASSSTENRLPEPVKSRCQIAWSGCWGRAGCSTCQHRRLRSRASAPARAPAPGAPSSGSPASAARARRGTHRRARRRCPASRCVSLEPRPVLLVRRRRAEHRVRVADEHLGPGVDHDVGAELQRLVEERRRPGIVDDDRDARAAWRRPRSPAGPASRTSASRGSRRRSPWSCR